jgi:hypothetical protein
VTSVTGRWRITEMDMWDREAIDLVRRWGSRGDHGGSLGSLRVPAPWTWSSLAVPAIFLPGRPVTTPARQPGRVSGLGCAGLSTGCSPDL